MNDEYLRCLFTDTPLLVFVLWYATRFLQMIRWFLTRLDIRSFNIGFRLQISQWTIILIKCRHTLGFPRRTDRSFILVHTAPFLFIFCVCYSVLDTVYAIYFTIYLLYLSGEVSSNKECYKQADVFFMMLCLRASIIEQWID
jgi:hypothetical protein